MVRLVAIQQKRHRARRAVLTRVLLPDAREPVARRHTGRDDVFFVRRVGVPEEFGREDRDGVEFVCYVCEVRDGAVHCGLEQI